jgi:hypothetical protein
LEQGQRELLQAHLDRCPECARRLKLEDDLLGLLKSSLQRATAPPGLESRIRTELERQWPSRSVVRWLASPWLAAAAAAVLLAVLLVPSTGIPGRPRVPPSASPLQVAQDVTLVDLDCDRAGMGLAAQRRCRDPFHVNALKTDRGTYWSISAESTGFRELLLDPALRGQRLRIEGVFHPSLETVRLRRVQRLGPVRPVVLRH